MRSHTPYHLLAKAIASYCMVVFLGFSLYGAQFTQLNNGQILASGLKKGVALISADGKTHNPFSSPLKSESVCEELEFESETETGNDIDIESLFQIVSAKESLLFSVESNLFEQLTLSIQNRPSVSLYVLFHSWKGYLA
ncbi:MAG TPA: hypothetical protein VK174_08970 [Chitinophagales bacterium]|nr:hypothetical protein [Chitinophagales bacterium]